MLDLKRRRGLSTLLKPALNLKTHQPPKPPAHCEQRWSIHLERDLLDGSPRQPVREGLAYHITEVVEIAAEEGWEHGESSLALAAVEPPNRDGLKSEAITVPNIRPLIASPALRLSPALLATGFGQQAP
jgi:hypothetical protein